MFPSMKKFKELIDRYKATGYGTSDPSMNVLRDQVIKEVIALKKPLLMDFQKFVKQLESRNKGKPNPSHIALGSFAYLMDDAFSKQITGKTFPAWWWIYNDMVPRGYKIGDRAYRKAIGDALDEVHGRGTFAEALDFNKKDRQPTGRPKEAQVNKMAIHEKSYVSVNRTKLHQLAKQMGFGGKHWLRIINQMIKNNGDGNLYVFAIRGKDAQVSGHPGDAILGTATIPLAALEAPKPSKNASLLKNVAKLASEHPEFRKFLVPIIKEAKEFSTEKARKEYLQQHPGADPKKHTVKKPGSTPPAKLDSVLKDYPEEFVQEIQPELKKLNRVLRGKPSFGAVSETLMDIQKKLEDDHRSNPQEFHKRAPLNRALAEYAKSRYHALTGDKWGSDKEAKEFPTEKALKDYLQKHPKADPKKHTVKQPGGKAPVKDEGSGGKDKVQEEFDSKPIASDHYQASKGLSISKKLYDKVKNLKNQNGLKVPAYNAMTAMSRFKTHGTFKTGREALDAISTLLDKVGKSKKLSEYDKQQLKDLKNILKRDVDKIQAAMDRHLSTKPQESSTSELQSLVKKLKLKKPDTEEMKAFKKVAPKKLSPARLMQKFLAKAKPETKERMKGVSPADFMKMLGAIMDEEETTGKKASVPMSNGQILKGLIRVAHANPETRVTLLPIIKKAIEFNTPEALKKYLQDHPGADPKKHTVKKQDSGKSKKEEDSGKDSGPDKSGPKKKRPPKNKAEHTHKLPGGTPVRVYDAGEDAGMDRYTVVVDGEDWDSSVNPGEKAYLGMSEGGRAVSQWGSAQENPKNFGKRVRFEDLDPDSQKHIIRRVEEED